MILVSYDGSDDSQAAVDRAAQLFPGAQTTVLTVWESCVDMMIRSGGMGMVGAPLDAEEIDTASERAALESASEGAQRAAAAGMVSEPLTANRPSGVAQAILGVADVIGADAIVLGTRGRGSAKSLLLGSVSHAVVQHADRAVVVVPSAGLSEHRRSWARHFGASSVSVA